MQARVVGICEDSRQCFIVKQRKWLKNVWFLDAATREIKRKESACIKFLVIAIRGLKSAEEGLLVPPSLVLQSQAILNRLKDTLRYLCRKTLRKSTYFHTNRKL